MIALTVRGDGAVLLALRSTEIRARSAARASVVRSTLAVLRRAKEKTSGPVLRNRTGTLRRKINAKTFEASGRVDGVVGIALSYAPAHEYGFDGVVNVRAHLRRVTQAFGRPIAPVEASVAAHARHVHLPERSFLRSSLAELRPAIEADFERAIAEAIR